jgi:hypothetical protein
VMGRSVVLGPLFLILYLAQRIRDHHDSNSATMLYSTVQAEAELYREARWGHAA